MSKLITNHPIALDDQKYIIPDNAEIGDNVGKVNYLWSHPYFHNDKWGISVSDSDYTYEIVGGNGDGTFAINASTGELTIADNSALSADKTITVRVKLYDWYYKDTTCTVLVIPEADCIFFDSSYGGGDSDGTRSKPYLKLNNYGVSTGTAGKTYFYKRGETYSSDRNEFENPKVAGEYPDYINMGAWGQGARPVIDMTGSSGHFVSVGTIPWGNDPIVDADICNNFRMFDFEITNDTAADRGHILVKPAGDNIEFHRIKCHNTSYEDGFIYLPTSDPIAGNEAERNIYFADIELSECQNRGFKIESEAVTVRNCFGENNGSLTGTEIPAPQAAHRPGVDIKYIVCICDDVSTNNLGLQVRAGKQTYQYCYLEGLANALVSYVHLANDSVGGDYNIDSTSGFSDIIIKESKQAGYFGRQGGTTDNPDGLKFERIKLIECEGGFQVAYGAINTLLSYIDASSTLGWGFKVFSHAGTGTKIENCTAMNTFGGSGGIDLDVSGVTVKNTNYSGLSGTIGTSVTNSTSSDPLVLIGSGTDLSYEFDLEGSLVADVPSIGAYEFAELQYTITATGTNGSITGQGIINDGENATLTAVPDSGYEFIKWEEDSVEVSTSNPYVFEVEDNRGLVAVFSVLKWDVTLSANPPEGGTVEEITTGPYAEDEDFEIEATPAEGYRFVDWTIYGTYFSDQELYEGTMGTEDLPLVANFELIPTYTVTMQITPEGGGTVEEITTGPYQTGEEVELMAYVKPGYTFVRWKNGEVEQTTNPNFKFNMGVQNLVLTAEFVFTSETYIRKGKWKPVSLT